MQALFYGIGAGVIAIIAIAAYRLSRSTNKRDPLLWGIFGVLALVTVVAQAELAEFFVLAGLVVLFVRARPRGRQAVGAVVGGLGVVAAIWLIERWFVYCPDAICAKLSGPQGAMTVSNSGHAGPVRPHHARSWTCEIAEVAMKHRANAGRNRLAHFRQPVRLEEVMAKPHGGRPAPPAARLSDLRWGGGRSPHP